MRKLLNLAVFVAFAVAMGLISLQSAVAATSGVSSFSALSSNDAIDWGTVGAAGTFPTNPFTGTSVGGQSYTVSQAGQTSFDRVDQGNGWNGNFAPGATLLWTLGGGPMSISFTNGIFGFGAQIQSSSFDAFGARVEAFDANSSLLGSFTLNGTSTTAGDNSAIFIGLLSTSNDIRKLTFSLDSAAHGDLGNFAIGNGALTTVSPIPEPEIYAMMGVGLLLMGFVVHRRRKE